MMTRQPEAPGQPALTHSAAVGRYRRVAMAISVALALVLVVKYVLPLVAPFVVGLVIALLIEPVVKFLEERLRVPRGLASILVLALSVMLLVVVIATMVNGILSELEQLIRLLPRYEADITRWATAQTALLKGYYDRLPDPVIGAIDSSGGAVYERVVAITKGLIDSLKGIPSLITTLTVAFIASYFMSRDKKLIVKSIMGILPKRWRGSARGLQSDVISSTMSYIRAQLILMSLTATVVLLSLLVLQVRYAWLIAIGAGLLDILPMVGPAAIFVPWVAALFVMGGKVLAVKLLVVLGVVMAIRQVFEAKIVGESVGVHPLVTLVSLYVSVSLFGLAGFVVGPAVVILGKALARSKLISPGTAR